MGQDEVNGLADGLDLRGLLVGHPHAVGVLELIRAHLADELEIDPARVTEETHFKRDLDADSLDLYTLVQELEDSYGVKMSDEEAAKIQTVGGAVDFVLAQGVGG